MFIRDHLLYKPTIPEHQIALRIANTLDSSTDDTIIDPLLQTRPTQKSKWTNKVILHYKHEARLETYKNDIHQLWSHIFNNTPVINTKLIIRNKNNVNTKKTLVRRCPIIKPHPQ
jgi:hypothetical protein